MSDEQQRRARVERIAPSIYRATNDRGAAIELSDGSDDRFTPVELLLVALAGCTALTAEPVVTRRATPTRLEIDARGDKIRDELGSRLVDLALTCVAEFDPDGDVAGAVDVLPDILRRAEERLCTVSRTVAVGTPTAAVVSAPDAG